MERERENEKRERENLKSICGAVRIKRVRKTSFKPS